MNDYQAKQFFIGRMWKSTFDRMLRRGIDALQDQPVDKSLFNEMRTRIFFLEISRDIAPFDREIALSVVDALEAHCATKRVAV